MNNEELKAEAIRVSIGGPGGKPGTAKVAAIKHIRELTSWGLKEAYNFVESINFTTGEFISPPKATKSPLSLVILPPEYISYLLPLVEEARNMAVLSFLGDDQRIDKLQEIIDFLCKNA